MYQFSENIVKKIYVTPIVEFEMMEVDERLLEGSVNDTSGDGNVDGEGNQEPPLESGAKSSAFSDDFVFELDMDY